MLELHEYPLAQERALSLVVQLGTERKITAITKLRKLYNKDIEMANLNFTEEDQYTAWKSSRMGLLTAKILVENAIGMVKNYERERDRDAIIWAAGVTYVHDDEIKSGGERYRDEIKK